MRRRAAEGRTEGSGERTLRDELIARAIALLEADGLEALTLRAAARAAGVSHMAPYRHFADKDALLAAVAEWGFRALAVAMRESADGTRTPRGRLKAIGLAYLAFARRRPALYRLMFGPTIIDKSRFPELAEAGRAAFACYAEAIEATAPRGTRRAPDGERAVAIATWSLVHGLASLLIDGRIALPGDAQAERALIEQVLEVHKGAFD